MQGCAYEDFDEIIRQGTDPSKCESWVVDKPQNHDAGYSLWTEKGNDWGQHHHRLLYHICRNDEMISTYDGKLETNIVCSRAWQQKLDTLVADLNTLNYLTQGGGAQGTEMELEKYCNFSGSPQSLFILGG